MDFWEEVQDFYHNRHFCDLRLVTADCPKGLMCHQLVMASVSTLLHDILRAHHQHVDENNSLMVNLPDVFKEDLEAVLQAIYAKIGGRRCTEDYMHINQGLTDLLGLCEPKDLRDRLLHFPLLKHDPDVDIKEEDYEDEFQDYYSHNSDGMGEDDYEDKPLKRRLTGTLKRKRRRASMPKKKKQENGKASALLSLSEEAKALLSPEAKINLEEAVRESLQDDPVNVETDDFWGEDAWKAKEEEKLVIKVPKRQKRNTNRKPMKKYKQKRAPKPELCNICGKSFNWTRSLEFHMQFVHGTIEKDIPCHLCDKKFNRKQTLVSHIKGVHVAAREYQCDQCEKQFSLKK